MDLDQWISKVKDGQHLSEDELQLLCEYVRTISSSSLLALGVFFLYNDECINRFDSSINVVYSDSPLLEVGYRVVA